MSFVITIAVREGIVMAADSRLTLNFKDPNRNDPNSQVERWVSVPQSDAANKLFLAQNRIGISTFGTGDISGVPISGFIESFITTMKTDETPEEAAESIKTYFRAIKPDLDTWFHIAGYCKSENSEPLTEAWMVHVAGNTKQVGIIRGIQAAVWNGELDIMNRLMADVQFRWSDQKPFLNLPWFRPPWNYFTLQDAVDFAVFAVRTTIDTMRFLPRLRTVRGPIDVLIIKPDGAHWLIQKQLHVGGD
jgi:hypothetical protein